MKTLNQIRHQCAVANCRNAGLDYRRHIHPKAFNGTREMYNTNISLAVSTVNWAAAAAAHRNTTARQLGLEP